MARYRGVQQSFTSGMLDPMVEANILSPLRQTGVKESVNFWHRPDGPVQKRGGIMPYQGLMDSASAGYTPDFDAVIRIDMPGGSCLMGLYSKEDAEGSPVTVVYLKAGGYSAVIPIDDDFVQMDHSKSHFAVTVEKTGSEGISYIVVETQEDIKPVQYTVTRSSTGGLNVEAASPTFTDWSDDWRWPSTCAFAGGRLFLGYDDTVLASRSPASGENRFYEFTMADYSYEWILNSNEVMMGLPIPILYPPDSYNMPVTDASYTHYDNTYTWNRKERVWMESDYGYTSTPDEAYMTRREITLTRWEFRSYKSDNFDGPYYYQYLTDEEKVNSILEDAEDSPSAWSQALSWLLDLMFIAYYQDHVEDGDYDMTVEADRFMFYADSEDESDEYKLYCLKQNTAGNVSDLSTKYPDFVPTIPDEYGTVYLKPNDMPAWTQGSGSASQEELERVKCYKVTMKITETWSNGIMQGQSITKTTEDVGSVSHPVNTVGASGYPASDIIGTITYTMSDKIETPHVQVDHAIELHETDIFGSSIQWIANIGRIVVATEDAVYISTSELYTPESFDLVPSVYVGSCSIQPSIVGPLFVFATSDRRRIYAGLYSNETQGLTAIDLTSNARAFFHRRIGWLKASDSPFLSLYAVTDDGRLMEGNVTIGSDGASVSAAWSEWRFAKGTPEMVLPMKGWVSGDERDEGAWMYIKMRISGTLYSAVMYYDEPYEYGLDTAKATAVPDSRAVRGLTLDFMTRLIPSAEEDTPERWNLAAVAGSPDPVLLPFEDGDRACLIASQTQGEVSWMAFPVTLHRDAEGGALWIDRPQQAGEELPAEVFIGLAVDAWVQLFQQLLPNNSGVMFTQKHSVTRLELILFRSAGGSVWYNGRKVRDLLQYGYGRSPMASGGIDPETGRFFSFSGPYGTDNPTEVSRRDELMVRSSEPYPFNLMAAGLEYSITEVS